MRCNNNYIVIGLISFFIFTACKHSFYNIDADDLLPDQLSFTTQIDAKGMNYDNSSLSAFGVFAFYTGLNSWESLSASICPNYLYNQEVNRQKYEGGWTQWTYSPVMYWPQTEEKLSIFAYAPFATPENGIQISSKTHIGAPALIYHVPCKIKSQQDVLYASPLLDQSKLNYLNKCIPLNFKHALTKVIFHAKIQNGKEPPKGQCLKIKSIMISNLISGGTLNFQTAGWSVQDGTYMDYMLTTQPEEGLIECNLDNMPVCITSPEGQLNLMPHIISSSAILSVQYALTDQSGTEIEILNAEHQLSSLISEFQMGKGVLFTIQLGLNSSGTVHANVLPWTGINTSGDFSSTYLNISRTKLEEYQDVSALIHYETDYRYHLFLSCEEQPPGSGYIKDESPVNGIIRLPSNLHPGKYKFKLQAGGIFRFIYLTVLTR